MSIESTEVDIFRVIYGSLWIISICTWSPCPAHFMHLFLCVLHRFSFFSSTSTAPKFSENTVVASSTAIHVIWAAPVNDRRLVHISPSSQGVFYVDRGRLCKREVIHTVTGDHSNYQRIEEGERRRGNATRSSKWALWQRLKAWKAAHVFPGSHINSLITQTRLASAAQHPEWAGSAQNRFANKQTIKRK